jgi:hypothetical protein
MWVEGVSKLSIPESRGSNNSSFGSSMGFIFGFVFYYFFMFLQYCYIQLFSFS